MVSSGVVGVCGVNWPLMKRNDAVPRVIRSPDSRAVVSIRLPFTNVPFDDPKSSMTYPLGVSVSLQ